MKKELRRTRKKHKRKLNIKNIIIILIFISLSVYGYSYYKNTKINNILIEGTSTIKDYEIIELANIKNYPNIFTLNDNEIIENIKTNDLVNTVSLKKSLDGTLRIIIEETKPLFYYETRSTYILSNGKYSNEQYLGLPTVINYVPDDKLENLIVKLNRVDQEIINSINEIEYSPSKNTSGEIIDDERFILKMNDGNTVHMNTINIEKLNNYFDIYEVVIDKFEGKLGVLMLDSNTDAYIFKTYEAIEKENENEDQL